MGVAWRAALLAVTVGLQTLAATVGGELSRRRFGSRLGRGHGRPCACVTFEWKTLTDLGLCCVCCQTIVEDP